MDVIVVLAGVGGFLGGTAAWAAYLSPRARAVRTAKAEALRRQLQFHADWEGERGRPGVAAKPGVMERLAGYDQRFAAIESKLNAPILNGKGEDALVKIAAVDTRTKNLLRRITVVERVLKTGGKP